MVSKRFFMKVIQQYWDHHRIELKKKYKQAQQVKKNPYWFWDQFLESMCTLGGVKNWGDKKEQYLHKLDWIYLSGLPSSKRKKIFQDLPNPRWRKRVSLYLESTFEQTQAMGGPIYIARIYDRLKTPKDKINFLKGFKGIGDKYARNIPMDIADSTFVSHIALDHRINELAKLISDYPSRAQYEKREQYFINLIKPLQIPNAWYLDRLLFSYYQDIKRTLANKK